MNVVADTHAWVWWLLRDPRLSEAARDAMERAGTVYLPAISLWEVAMLVEKGRIPLTLPVEEFFAAALESGRMEVAPLSPSVAALSVSPGLTEHGDPADRLIAATAVDLGLALVTRDARLRPAPGLTVIW